MEKTFGQKLKYLRKEQKLTQAKLAKELGVSAKIIRAWETDKCEPSLFYLRQIAIYFKVRVDYLIGLKI